MTDTIANYGIGIQFDKAIKGLRKFKSEAQKLNTMQAKMNQSQKRLRQNNLKKMYKAEDTLLASKLKREDKQHQEALGKTMARDLNKRKQHQKAVDRLDKKQQMSKSKANFKDSVSKLTSASGASSQAEGYRKLEAEQKKALKKQQQLGAAMNKDANALLRKEKARLKALERAKEAVRNSALMMKKEANEATRSAQASIRKQIATAKTAEEVRRIVAREKASLNITKKKSFLMQRMQNSSKQIAGNMVSAFAVGAMGTFVTRTGQDFEAVGNTMLSVSKDSKEAGDNLQYAKDEAYRLGLGLKESSKGFAKLLAARGDMSLGDTKNLFTGVSEMSTILGLTAEEGGRALTAIQQMASKGVISSEELNY